MKFDAQHHALTNVYAGHLNLVIKFEYSAPWSINLHFEQEELFSRLNFF